jgi:hypothetical protein
VLHEFNSLQDGKLERISSVSGGGYASASFIVSKIRAHYSKQGTHEWHENNRRYVWLNLGVAILSGLLVWGFFGVWNVELFRDGSLGSLKVRFCVLSLYYIRYLFLLEDREIIVIPLQVPIYSTSET